MPRPSRDSVKDFFEQIDVREDGCWLWTGKKTWDGYGRFPRDGQRTAYRWSYVHHKGPVPAGLHLDHLCEVKACVCPDHLEAVTPRENVRRARRLPAPGPRTRIPFSFALEPEQDDVMRRYSEKNGNIPKTAIVDEALGEYFAKRQLSYPRSHLARKKTGAVLRVQLDSEQIAVVDAYVKDHGIRSRGAMLDDVMGEYFARRKRPYERTYQTVTGLNKKGST